jgi:hypothetical protein
MFEKLVIKLLLYILNCIAYSHYHETTLRQHAELEKKCNEFLKEVKDDAVR